MDRPRFISRRDPIATATVAVAAPPVAMSVLMQRHVIAGLTMRAVKG